MASGDEVHELDDESMSTEPPDEPTDATGVTLEELPFPDTEERIRELEGRLRTVSAAYRAKEDEIAQVRSRLSRRATEQEEIRRGEVVSALFEPVENLHRSVEAAKGTPTEAGLRMVHEQFMGALRALGLEEVPGAGERFDPNVHEALATQPVESPEQDGIVLSVFSQGYRIGRRLIRPARVVIGSWTEPVGEA